MKKRDLKWALGVIALCLLISIGSFQYALSLNPGEVSEVWVQPPFSEASYVVGVYNSTHCYAKNCTTAAYEYLGTNATVAVQSAVTALPNGGKILFKAGSLTIDGKVTVPKDDFVFEAEAQEATTILLGANGYFSIESASDLDIGGVTFANFKFDGQNLATRCITTENMGAGKRLRYLRVLNNRFSNFGAVGAITINYKNNELGIIEGNDFGFNRNIHIQLYDDGYNAGNVRIVRNFFYLGYSATPAKGIVIKNSQATKNPVMYWSIANQFYGTTFLTSVGISLESTASGYVKSVRSMGDRAEGCRLLETTVSSGNIIDVSVEGANIWFAEATNASLISLVAGVVCSRVRNSYFERGGSNAITGVEDAGTGTGYDRNNHLGNTFRYFPHVGSGSVAFNITGTAVEDHNITN